jgi:BMFP domain-containing protein YqiC
MKKLIITALLAVGLVFQAGAQERATFPVPPVPSEPVAEVRQTEESQVGVSQEAPTLVDNDFSPPHGEKSDRMSERVIQVTRKVVHPGLAKLQARVGALETRQQSTADYIHQSEVKGLKVDKEQWERMHEVTRQGRERAGALEKRTALTEQEIIGLKQFASPQGAQIAPEGQPSGAKGKSMTDFQAFLVAAVLVVAIVAVAWALRRPTETNTGSSAASIAANNAASGFQLPEKPKERTTKVVTFQALPSGGFAQTTQNTTEVS